MSSYPSLLEQQQWAELRSSTVGANSSAALGFEIEMRLEARKDERGFTYEEYFEGNQLRRRVDKAPTGEILEEIDYSWDSAGRCLAWVGKDGKGKMIYRFEVRREHGRAPELLEYDKHG